VKVVLIASLAFTLALAGCSTASVSGQGGRFSATGASGGSVGVNIQGGTAAGVVVGVAAIAALFGEWRDPAIQAGEPKMLEGRAISEVDCAQPILDWSKNLKCKASRGDR
jgi:hypothetical protein